MRKSDLDHPLWAIELGLTPLLAALLCGAIVYPILPALLVGALLGLLGGLLLGVGVTLLVTRWAVTQARRPAPIALLDEPIDGEWREIAA